MENLFTPLDSLGGLVAERHDGEPLAAYRARVARVAAHAFERDAASPDWLGHREAELAARTGHPVRLLPGGADPALVEEARSRMFTYARLSELSGPFVWPEYGAGGRKTLYNEGAAGGPEGTGSGVGSGLDLEPARDGGRLVTSAGFVVVGGVVYYVPARLDRVALRLPEGTTETAVAPVEIAAPLAEGGGPLAVHGHRLQVLDRHTLRVVGDDHEHVLTAGPLGWSMTAADGGANPGHTHGLRPVDTDGPCFMALATEAAPEVTGGFFAGAGASSVPFSPRTSRVDGFLGVPVLHLDGVEVTTDDGVHAGWVDPHTYYAAARPASEGGARFTIGDRDHVHVVERASASDDFLTATAATPDGHTHRLPLPEVPAARLVVPVPDVGTGPTAETSGTLGEHPFMVRTRTVEGWTVVSSAFGLGTSLTLAFDVGRALAVPAGPCRPGHVVGIGPEAPATAVHVLSQTPTRPRPGDRIALRVRTEDAWTGGVPGEGVQARVVYRSSGEVRAERWTGEHATGPDAEGVVPVHTPADLAFDQVEVEFLLRDGSGAWAPAGRYGLSTDATPAPDAPRLLAPAQGASMVEAAAVTFRWGPVDGATRYVFELSADPEFRTTAHTAETQNLSLTGPPLEPSARYYWRVRAVRPAAQGPWAQSEFTTVEPPAPPSLASPADGADVRDPDPYTP